MNFRVRPSRAVSGISIVVGTGMLIFGVSAMGSAPGAAGGFLLLWVVTCVAIIGYHALNLIRPEGAALTQIDAQVDGLPPAFQASAPQPPASGARADFDERLRNLDGLRADGLISDEEFAAKRAELMAEKW